MNEEISVMDGARAMVERSVTQPQLSLPDTALAIICKGDLTPLTPEQRVTWYRMRCEAVGLDFRTQPFLYTALNNKLVLYPTKTATEQLCGQRAISTAIIERRNDDGVYSVLCRATLPNGQFTDSTGVVWVKGLVGEAFCNQLMKAESKAKRRAVLSLTGLGMLDETELETIPGTQTISPDVAHTSQIITVASSEPTKPVPANVNPHTGEIAETGETLAGTVNTTGAQCPSCHCPDRKKHTPRCEAKPTVSTVAIPAPTTTPIAERAPLTQPVGTVTAEEFAVEADPFSDEN